MLKKNLSKLKYETFDTSNWLLNPHIQMRTLGILMFWVSMVNEDVKILILESTTQRV